MESTVMTVGQQSPWLQQVRTNKKAAAVDAETNGKKKKAALEGLRLPERYPSLPQPTLK